MKMLLQWCKNCVGKSSVCKRKLVIFGLQMPQF